MKFKFNIPEMPLCLRVRALPFSIAFIALSIFALTSIYLGQAAPQNTEMVVSITADTVSPADGRCSLREAVISANNNPAGLIVEGECSQGNEDSTDTIILENGETYTLTVAGLGENKAAGGDLDILDNSAPLDLIIRTVDPAGDPAVIDASGLPIGDRVLHLIASNVQIENVRITGGNSGLGIGGGVLIEDGEASLELIDSIVFQNRTNSVIAGGGGGGIAHLSDGLLLLDGTIMSFNTAKDNGGGILVGGMASVEIRNGSTIAGNRTKEGCGGGVHLHLGGSLLVDASELNSHVAELGSGGAICSDGGSVTFNSGALRNNAADADGGAIYSNGGTVTLNSTAVVENQALNGSGGALYLQENSLLSVDASEFDTNKATNSSGGAIYNIDGTVGIDGSTLKNNISGFVGGAIYSKNGPVTVSASTLEKNNGATNGGAIYIFDGSFSATDSLIKQNQAAYGAGVYLITVESTFTNMTIEKNIATNHAGGIMIEQSDLEMVDSTIRENRADNQNGGGIFVSDESTFTVQQSAFIENDALSGWGGAIYTQFDSIVMVQEATFLTNRANIGGAISSVGQLSVDNTFFEFNQTTLSLDKWGGAISAFGPLEIDSSTFVRNNGKRGGALFVSGLAEKTVMNSTFSDNDAIEQGGAIFVDDSGPLQIIHSTIAFNTATVEGAGVYVADNGVFHSRNSIIANNAAAAGNGDCALHAGGIIQALGSNLDSDSSCLGFTLSGQNPQLNLLADNGGLTMTHLPEPGSPVLDAASETGCDMVGHVDQRDNNRPAGACDLGSVERDGTPPVDPEEPVGTHKILLPLIMR